MGDKEKTDLDIYEDLPEFRYDETLDKLKADVAKLEADNLELQGKLIQMGKEKEALESNCRVLNQNLSSLLKTARLEITRKERMIDELRSELNATKRSSRISLKRPPSTKETDETYCKLKSQRMENALKRPRSPIKSVNSVNEVKTNSEGVTCIRDITASQNIYELRKQAVPPQPSMKLELSTEERKIVNSKENISFQPSGARPTQKFVTLFSARMHRKLYKLDSKEVEPAKICLEERAPSEAQPSTSEVKSESDERKEDKAVVASTVTAPCKPQGYSNEVITNNQLMETKKKFAETEPAQSGGLSCASVHSTSVTGSLPLKFNDSGLGVSSQPTISAEPVPIRPNDSVLYQNNVKVSEVAKSGKKSDLPVIEVEDHSGTIPAKVSSTPSNGFKQLENLEKVAGVNKRKRPATLLPSSKGAATKKVFAPISSQWNRSKLPSEVFIPSPQKSSQFQNVDFNDESQHKDALLSIFGSPIKWAEEGSSDSHKIEDGPEKNKHREVMYNLFGSSFQKGADSSSETPPSLTLPATAYDDSCCTTSAAMRSLTPSQLSVPKSNQVQEDQNPKLPPPAQPILRKSKSIFSPLKDSKGSSQSTVNPIHDDRSSLSLMFPFKVGSKYEDTVLGHFDDTAQFVSALAKVESKLSPLKSTDVTLDSSMSVSPHPISFKEVFQSKPLDSNDEGRSTDDAKCNTASNSSQQTEVASVVPGVQPQIVISSKFIHRSNFTSSSVFSSSDSQFFPDKPINILQPRKTPRLVSNSGTSNSVNSSDKEVKVNARIAINDSFITEQEQRVRKWEEENLFELKSVSPKKSPRLVKSLNVSPNKKVVKKDKIPHVVVESRVDNCELSAQSNAVNMILSIASGVLNCNDSCQTKPSPVPESDVTHSGVALPCVSNSTGINITKPVHIKTSNFKRSSSLKKPGEIRPVECAPQQVSKSLLYRRKSDVSFQASSTTNEVVVNIGTCSTTSSTKLEVEDEDQRVKKWVLHRIDVEKDSLYLNVNSYPSGDPRFRTLNVSCENKSTTCETGMVQPVINQISATERTHCKNGNVVSRDQNSSSDEEKVNDLPTKTSVFSRPNGRRAILIDCPIRPLSKTPSKTQTPIKPNREPSKVKSVEENKPNGKRGNTGCPTRQLCRPFSRTPTPTKSNEEPTKRSPYEMKSDKEMRRNPGRVYLTRQPSHTTLSNTPTKTNESAIPASSELKSIEPTSPQVRPRIIRVNKRNANFGNVSAVHSSKVIVSGRRPAAFGVSR